LYQYIFDIPIICKTNDSLYIAILLMVAASITNHISTLLENPH